MAVTSWYGPPRVASEDVEEERFVMFEVQWRRVAPLVALSCCAVAAGCGGSSDKGSGGGSSGGGARTAADTTRLVTDTPAATGSVDKVTWALPYGEPLSLDPQKAGDYSPNTVVNNLCDNLLRLQPDYSIKPGLASYRQPDPKTIVFTIQSSARFWDGRPVTPADVVYSLDRNLDPKVESPAAAAFQHVRSIKATGAHEVTVKFKQPDAAFLAQMSSLTSAVSERAFVEKAGKSYGTPAGGLMCSGPFKLDKWTSGEQIATSANPDYWDSSLQPRAKTFIYKFIPDSSTLTSALQSGEVDGTYEAPVGSLRALRSSSAGTLYVGPSTQSLSIGATTSTGPAADPNVRTALDLAIDKTALVRNVLRGAGAPLKTFTPPFTYNGSPARDVYQQGYDALADNSRADLDQARKLIAAANVGSRTLTLATISGVQLATQTATIVQATGKAIGLNIKIKQMQPTEFSALFYDPSKRAGVDFIIAMGYIDTPNVLNYAPLFTNKPPAGLFNWVGYSNAEVTRELDAAQADTDPQSSAQHFVAAQKLYAPARLQVSLANIYENLFMNKKIAGATASFSYINSPWAASVGAAGSN
jgi:peptide/nickel transport system substrate-binding protein